MTPLAFSEQVSFFAHTRRRCGQRLNFLSLLRLALTTAITLSPWRKFSSKTALELFLTFILDSSAVKYINNLISYK